MEIPAMMQSDLIDKGSAGPILVLEQDPEGPLA
jgi:hypothetical protein